MSSKFLALLLTICLFSCTSPVTSPLAITADKPSLSLSQEQAWKMMIGKWYGKQPTKEGGIREEIIERYSQGTYKVTFRFQDKGGKLESKTEAGTWGIAGPIYFTVFRGFVDSGHFSPTDPNDPYNYDAYEVSKLNTEEFEYQSVTSGNRFALKKVPDNFDFPIK